MPTGKQAATNSTCSSNGHSSSSGESDNQRSAVADFSGVQVVLVPDEAFRRVTVTFLRRNSAAEGDLTAGRARQPLTAVLQQEEAERKFSSPDRPQEDSLAVGRPEGPQVPVSPWLAQQEGEDVLRELRESVVALTERAACLEGPDGAADNQPEVRKVKCRSLIYFLVWSEAHVHHELEYVFFRRLIKLPALSTCMLRTLSP